MLKMKQSQVLFSMIDGVSSVALGVIVLELTGIILLAYLAGAIMFGISAYVVISIQARNHANRSGYINMVLFVLSFIWIWFGLHWVVAVLLYVLSLWVGFRYTPVPVPSQPEKK